MQAKLYFYPPNHQSSNENLRNKTDMAVPLTVPFLLTKIISEMLKVALLSIRNMSRGFNFYPIT